MERPAEAEALALCFESRTSRHGIDRSVLEAGVEWHCVAVNRKRDVLVAMSQQGTTEIGIPLLNGLLACGAANACSRLGSHLAHGFDDACAEPIRRIERGRRDVDRDSGSNELAGAHDQRVPEHLEQGGHEGGVDQERGGRADLPGGVAARVTSQAANSPSSPAGPRKGIGFCSFTPVNIRSNRINLLRTICVPIRLPSLR